MNIKIIKILKNWFSSVLVTMFISMYASRSCKLVNSLVSFKMNYICSKWWNWILSMYRFLLISILFVFICFLLLMLFTLLHISRLFVFFANCSLRWSRFNFISGFGALSATKLVLCIQSRDFSRWYLYLL